ncbi:DUF397 domain-containing protein [Streptomyces sp. NPDC002838]|uniref:DUF397 domain-containing protein n=1 Tax=Streptomyces sp. NPDC002838 TaxID=3154436 RepID=UPI003324A9EE
MGTSQDLTNARWRKSSYSGNTGGDCVEVAATSALHIRDSKRRLTQHVTVSPTTWSAFLNHVSK